jgi:hypothetical protein
VGGATEELLFESAEILYAEHSYGAGRFLLCLSYLGRLFYSLPLTGERKPQELLKTDYSKDEPHVSPDQRWVAYGANQSGRWEVYTAAFPSFSDRRPLSKYGGAQPRWRKDGRELYYVAPDGKMMVVEVKTGVTLEASSPRELFQTPIRLDPTIDQYAVTGDGRRFLIVEPLGDAARPMTVVLNWTADLRRQH